MNVLKSDEYALQTEHSQRILTDESFSSKTHSADLLWLHMNRGLVSPTQFSIEGWNSANYTLLWVKKKNKQSNTKRLFSCLFACPIAGKLFPCGLLKKNTSAMAETEGVSNFYSE